MKPTKPKSLGQIAYERNGGIFLHGPWDKAMECVRDAYEQSAETIEAEVLRRIRKKYPLIEYP